jgi:hypothetical protein
VTSEASLDRRWLAAVAFVAHVFGLWLLGYRLGPAQTSANRWAIASTVAAMGAASLVVGARAVIVAWLVGHFLWSAYLARAVLRGDAGFRPPVPLTGSLRVIMGCTQDQRGSEMGRHNKPFRDQCSDCGRAAEPETGAHSLIGDGWRLYSCRASDGRETMNWRCPECARRHRTPPTGTTPPSRRS